MVVAVRKMKRFGLNLGDDDGLLTYYSYPPHTFSSEAARQGAVPGEHPALRWASCDELTHGGWVRRFIGCIVYLGIYLGT